MAIATAGGGSGLAFVDCGVSAAAGSLPQGRRRGVTVNGRRIKTIDIHAHCAVPEALELMGQKLEGPQNRPDLDMATAVSLRLRLMDEQAIDVEALSINPNWYGIKDRELAAKVIEIQNDRLAEACARNPDRFVAFATAALQFPDLAAEQIEHAARKLGLRGVAIGGNVAGMELSDPALHPFWAKAESLGILVFMHPQGDGAPSQLGHRFRGNGYLSNVIGNPLETTIALSHLIFEGTLDRYPGIKICAAHGGGYLPSYAARMDRGCTVRPDLCHGGTWGPIRKRPTEYLRQLYYDTMVFSEEGLRHLVAEVGADRLMIGTDYPYPWTSTAVEHVMESPHLTDEQKAAILGGTAAKLLGLSTS
jgi:aminocarboxymuconate-semialdehyde decarboxylase